MNFFWPTSPKAEPTTLARFGRVTHWIFVGIAAAFMFAITSMLPDAEKGGDWSGPEMFLFVAAGFFIAGRAARYIFSGE